MELSKLSLVAIAQFAVTCSSLSCVVDDSAETSHSTTPEGQETYFLPLTGTHSFPGGPFSTCIQSATRWEGGGDGGCAGGRLEWGGKTEGGEGGREEKCDNSPSSSQFPSTRL